ncbi:MAG: ABC transporter permease [Oscillospiraceae bacterium]|jgi:lipopolysaccharide transport system permease protein|nr:ABC transporter permease [Oscillospiraceae bacterium]
MASQSQQPKTVIITAGGKDFRYWKDLWVYRGLMTHMTRRDFTVRYKQTFIGVAWSLINPLFTMVMATLVFGVLAGIGEGIAIPYSICVYVGGLPWGLFARCLSQGSNTFITNAALMKKVYYPRLISPLSSMLSAIVDTLISYAMLFVMIGLYALRGGSVYLPPLRMLWSLPLLLPIALLGTFVGLFLASFIIRWRDFAFAIPVILQLGQFFAPVSYTLDDLTSRLAGHGPLLQMLLPYVYRLNPMTGFIVTFKWLLLDDPAFTFEPLYLAVSFGWLAIFLVLGVWRFRKAERSFVDLV